MISSKWDNGYKTKFVSVMKLRLISEEGICCVLIVMKNWIVMKQSNATNQKSFINLSEWCVTFAWYHKSSCCKKRFWLWKWKFYFISFTLSGLFCWIISFPDCYRTVTMKKLQKTQIFFALKHRILYLNILPSW